MTGERVIQASLLTCGALWLVHCGLPLEPDLPEAGGYSECDDGIDNDTDGRVDYPFDPGCEAPGDPAEDDPGLARACSDGVDNDGDGRIDFDVNANLVRDIADDPGCDSAADDDESNIELPECADGIDDDGDGKVDGQDPQCHGSNDRSEAPECENGRDDDGDGQIDFPDDLECTDATDDSEIVL